MAKQPEACTRELAEWAARVKFEDIPGRVIEEARLQIMSVLGSVFAGFSTEAGKQVIAASDIWSDGGACRILPTGKNASLKEAASCTAALSMVLDYDDYMMAGHTGHSAVIVPLMLALREGLKGRDLILAQVIANEVEARIGGSVIIGPLNGQMWAFIHAAGAACAAGRIAGLSPDAMASAIGIALSQPPYPLEPGFMGGDSKLVTASAPIVSGISAAQMAAAGLKGPVNILEAPGGFCESFSYGPLYGFFSKLGECWLTDTLSCKLYPGCAYIDPVIDCLMELSRKMEIDPNDVFRVDVHAGILTVRMNDTARPHVLQAKTHPVTLNFYVPYNVAVYLADGILGPEQFEPSRIADPALWEFGKRVRLHHDPAISGDFIKSVSELIDIRSAASGIGLGSVSALASRLGVSSPANIFSRGREISDIFGGGRKLLETLASSGSRKSELADTAAGFRMAIGARVSMQVRGMGTVEYEQKVPYGAAGRPFEEKRTDVMNKFLREASRVIDMNSADTSLSLINRIEDLDSGGIQGLVDMCCSPAGLSNFRSN